MNSVEFSLSTCRICLQDDDATYPIFDESTTAGSILSQLNKCFKEKIKDLEGYPRSICSSCKMTLDLLYEFIDRYRASCKLFESLAKVKTEVDESFIENYDNFIWDDKEYVVIKIEDSPEKENLSNSSEVIEKLKPLPGLKITKLESKKCLEQKESKTTTKTKTSKLASSIMEGESKGNGDEWRGITKTSEIKKNPPKKTVKIKLPKHITKLIQIQEEQNTENNPVLCDYCGAVFNRKKRLQHHIKIQHKRTPVTCTLCSKTCPSEFCLRLHNRRCHTEKTLQCEQCPKMFTTKDLLKGHIKSVHNKHLYPKIYSCKYCDKTFKGYYCCVAHERAVHTGLRPAVCKVCDKAFYHVIYLKEHMRLHTGDLPYKCPFCDRACAIHSNLKSHLRTHKRSELNNTVMSKMKPSYFKFLKNC